MPKLLTAGEKRFYRDEIYNWGGTIMRASREENFTLIDMAIQEIKRAVEILEKNDKLIEAREEAKQSKVKISKGKS